MNKSDMSSMSLVEVLDPISPSYSRRDACLVALYYSDQVLGNESTVATVRQHLKLAKVKSVDRWNISDIFAKSGSLTYRTLRNDGPIWSLTKLGKMHVEVILSIQTDSEEGIIARVSLQDAIEAISDSVTREYVQESYRCFQNQCFRATIVFSWSGAVRFLQERALTTDNTELNSTIRKHDQSAVSIRKIEDFARIKENTQLLAFRDIGIIDKSEWRALSACLDLRNDCGHPTKVKPGANTVAAHLESLTSIVFTNTKHLAYSGSGE